MFPTLALALCAVLFTCVPWIPAGVALTTSLIAWFCFFPPIG